MNDEEIYEGELEAEVQDVDVAAILASYRAKKMREHMVGPGVSFVFHIIVLLCLAFFVKAKVIHEEPAIEVIVEEVEIVELEEPQIEEIEDVVEEEFTDTAPSLEVEAPTPTETTDAAIEDVSDEAPESDDDMEMEEVLDIAPISTPLKLSGLYGGRSAAGRSGQVRRFGGSAAGQDAVLRALRWLAKVQMDNGAWESNTALSGLALLCFLAHGDTPLSEEFGLTVQKAMQWLAGMMPADGTGMKGGHGGVYNHGIATYAISEAYGMTQIPFLKTAMENGLSVIVKGQQRGGGWNYNYDDKGRWDLSVAAWQMQAIKAGYVAGADVPGLHETVKKAIRFTKSAQKGYTFGYSSPGGNGNLTGAGTVCLQLLGAKDSKEMLNGTEYVMDKRLKLYEAARNNFKAQGKPVYGWYYDTQAAFQAQGAQWKAWRKVFEPVLIQNQHRDGYWVMKGGHNVGSPLAEDVYHTTLCCLQLEVYYRYLPSFQLTKGGGGTKGAKKVSLLDDDDTDLIIE
jgi:hypothetical protein